MKLGTPNLRRHEFGDPAVAYERNEAGTCHGCVHEYIWETVVPTRASGVLWTYHCRIGRKYGRKCPKYRVREAVTLTDGDG